VEFVGGAVDSIDSLPGAGPLASHASALAKHRTAPYRMTVRHLRAGV